MARVLSLLAVGAVLPPSLAQGVSLFVHEGVTLEPQDLPDMIRLRELGAAKQGFLTGVFQWAPAQSAWVLRGNLAADGFSEWMSLTPDTNGGGNVEFEASGNGTGISAATLQTPTGQVFKLNYQRCAPGISCYYRAKTLPIGQQTFGDGKYLFTYTLTAGGQVVRTCYMSGRYPKALEITAPGAGATGLNLTPTIKWTAIGAARYRLFVTKVNGSQVYQVDTSNSQDINLSHTIPAGYLLPGVEYVIRVHANSPMVNCGYKVLVKELHFTTAPN